MKTISGLWGQAYLRRIGVVLIAIALVAAVVSCNGAVQYDLTIGSSAGGQVTDPGEGTSTYDDGDVVDLVATPDCGYVFDQWTGDTGTVDDVNAAATNITMNADYDINANFKAIPADHFKVYAVDYETAPSVGLEVLLEDQFGTFTANVTDAVGFGNPAEKEHAAAVTPIHDPDRHYTMYELDYDFEADSVVRSVEISNQFQENVEVTVYGPVALVVPTQKEDHEMVECLNHYLVYYVDEAYYFEFPPVEGVNLKDQFIPNGEDVTVNGPMMFANPVKKTVVDTGDVAVIEDPDLHYVLYDIYDAESPPVDKRIQIDNQFGQEVLDLTTREVLAVPSQKNVPPTPALDHFKCYNATGPAPDIPEGLELLDQFHDYWLAAGVLDPMLFCNPVDKVHGTVQISSNPDNHLTVYKISAPESWYTVTVDNQFGEAGVSQELTVYGPVALALPTQKVEPGDHGMPKYVDHYLLYKVWEPVPLDVSVGLDDQFPPDDPGVTVQVGPPIYFANPCLKGPVDLGLEGLWDPDEHLVFYQISDNPEFWPSVFIKNQFFQDEGVPLDLYDNWELLAVPSVKVEWSLLD
jgi:hypothetical protein